MDLAKQAGMQLTAGGSAGLVEVCLMHPLDLVKTRMQIQKQGASVSVYRTLQTIVHKEGVSGLYKGILPPIMAETPKRATKFFTFEQYKKLFTSESIPLPITYSLAGALSGCTEALVICPFEVVKVRLQADKDVPLNQQRSSWSIAREISGRDGFGSKGLYRGLTSTLARHGIWNMVYFGMYHTVKLHYPLPQDTSPSVDLAYRFTIGLAAGTIASCVNIPFDVAKSRIQAPTDETKRIYHTSIQTVRLVAKQEGVGALYRGLAPKIMRLGPGGAIMLIVYENVYAHLQKTF